MEQQRWWRRYSQAEEIPTDDKDAWEWLRNPVPPASEEALFATLRWQMGLPDQIFFTDRGFGSLGFLEPQAVGQALKPGFLREHNPIVRHTVLRRQTLEDAGLLERIGVDVHSDPEVPTGAYSGVEFSGLGLLTNLPLRPCLPGSRSVHGGAAKTHEGGRIQENDASATDLFKLCFRSKYPP